MRYIVVSLRLVSLLLLLAIGATWVRSHYVLDWFSITCTRFRWEYQACSIYGGFQFGAMYDATSDGEFWESSPSDLVTVGHQLFPQEAWLIDRKVLGFRFSFKYRRPDAPLWSVRLPYWFLAGAFAVGPLAWIRRRYRARVRRRLGLCLHCGYDLRASHEVCPECGTNSALVHRTGVTPETVLR